MPTKRLHQELAELLAEILVADMRQFPDRTCIPAADDKAPEPDADSAVHSSAIMRATSARSRGQRYSPRLGGDS